MDPVIICIFVFGLLVTMVLPQLLKRNLALKARFEKMSNPDLIHSGLRAGVMRGHLRFMAYLWPIPVFILVYICSIERMQTLIFGVAFIAVFACFAGSSVFGVMEKLAATELEKRKSSEGAEE